MRFSQATRFAALLALASLLLFSCDKINGALKNVQGKVAGQVLDQSGHGRGYVSVELVPEGGGEPERTTAEDSGNFMFDLVTPGTYTIRVMLQDSTGSSMELPSDNPVVKLSPGRTMQQNVTLKPAAAK